MLSSFLQGCFIFISLFGLFYFLVRKRSFDYISLGYFSSLVYFMPLFFGYTGVDVYSEIIPIDSKVYIVGVSVLFSLLISAEIFTRSSVRVVGLSVYYELISYRKFVLFFLLVFALIGLIGTTMTTGAELFSANKSSMMEKLSRFYILMSFSSILGLVSAYLFRNKIYILLFLQFLMFDLFIGFRFPLAIAFISIVVLWLSRQNGRNLFVIAWRHRVIFFLILLGIIFVFVYKEVYIAVKLGDFDTVFERVTSFEIYQNIFVSSEPFITQHILNVVFLSGFSTDGSYLFQNVYQLIPFSNEFHDVKSFSEMYQPILFPSVSYGMAGNWWAEWYAAFSWFGVFIAILIYVGGLYLFSALHSRWRYHKNRLVLLSVAGSFLAFYIHRNEVAYFITLEKRIVIFWLLVTLAALIVVFAFSRPSVRLLNTQKTSVPPK